MKEIISGFLQAVAIVLLVFFVGLGMATLAGAFAGYAYSIAVLVSRMVL